MAGSDGGSTTQTTNLDPVQRRALESVIKKSEKRYKQGPLQFFPGETLATQDANVASGEQSLLDSIPFLKETGSTALQALMGDLNIDAVNDPRTLNLVNAAIAPINENFTESVLPSISSAATSQGAFGGDRADVLKNQAALSNQRAVGEASSRIFSDAYQSGLNQRIAALGLLPSVAQQTLLPGEIERGVGAARTDRAQQEIDADRERFEFEQFAPEAQLDNFVSRVSGINLGGSTVQETVTDSGLFGK